MEPNPHLHKPAQMLLEKGKQLKRVPDEQWLMEYWESENKNNIDPGFRLGGLPSPDPKGRYKSYAESFKDPAVRNRSKSPLDYKDWLRMTRWRYEERGPHMVYMDRDDPEWWRGRAAKSTYKPYRQRAK